MRQGFTRVLLSSGAVPLEHLTQPSGDTVPESDGGGPSPDGRFLAVGLSAKEFAAGSIASSRLIWRGEPTVIAACA